MLKKLRISISIRECFTLHWIPVEQIALNSYQCISPGPSNTTFCCSPIFKGSNYENLQAFKPFLCKYIWILIDIMGFRWTENANA